MVMKPTFGHWLSIDKLNSLDNYILITIKDAWNIVKPLINNKPLTIIFNNNMDHNYLKTLFESIKPFIKDSNFIIGLGGGTACDTAKLFTWWLKNNYNLDLNLILIPSIISNDAFLCSSIAIREKNIVRYIGKSKPKEIIIDYNLIKKAPKNLNRAGVSDIISIASALGDWKLERDEINGNFNLNIFNTAKKIAIDLMDNREEIKEIAEKGIKAIVDAFYNEVLLCESYGSPRPEEGSEHFLAYCLESITKDQYIHGKLIGMTILISLYLQEEYAEFSLEYIKQFFNNIKIKIKPEYQNISYQDIKKALLAIQKYVIDEKLIYSIYNSPRLKLNAQKINEIIKLLKKL